LRTKDSTQKDVFSNMIEEIKERDTHRISPESVSPQEGGDLLSRIAVQYHRRARA
jgi:hypothetical protein